MVVLIYAPTLHTDGGMYVSQAASRRHFSAGLPEHDVVGLPALSPVRRNTTIEKRPYAACVFVIYMVGRPVSIIHTYPRKHASNPEILPYGLP